MPQSYPYYQPDHLAASPSRPPNKRNRTPFFMLGSILGGCLFFCLLGSFLAGWFLLNRTSIFNPAELDPPRIFESGDYSIVSKPTIDAEFIDLVLQHYDSPAQGKGQKLYDYGVKYGIDPAYALAFFLHESRCGTRGVATTTLALGNIRHTEGYENYKGYRKYETWEAGFEDWYKLMTNLYIKKWNLFTVDEIIPVYAPAEDNNDEGAYIRTVKRAVDTWRSGTVVV